ncbi:30S ribosomal protein S1 [Stenotrophomonas rhizophila]|jgi:small subunit ribosomal protein S1|uniref:30S ribosomal protein S1 n=1 Tax=Stenotrophomonas nematodicola TaxID=2656746 RepID=A0ABW7CXV9_9GAMM|nr:MULTISPECIES: 30S ribosomal protein S1 [Stenotrophomonas]HBZ47198.1 30S ribosomal protein S1 [Stenotrophomonas sp.]AOA72131.1 30S ribosomal protein S1 [Stenotrophomonas rhizophila]MCS4236004.1 small subunit ribosomal protein S1 [Stenotrophomonas sp. BIGb0135]MDQ1062934.1 small subunit ribosomal protein S1 [Stenotrophomonas sp. SORGH_AS_0282]MDQ1188711.1 small subunit ribosomal protein S1 [Stenotrophomonas sp. SORGH_AS_0282]
MTESFAELFEASQANLAKLKPGAIVSGVVVEVRGDVVVINAGLKSEGIVPIEQFRNDAGEIDVAEGDVVKVALDSIENGFGETVLSREKAKRAMVWDELEEALEKNETITGRISGKVKGGFTVDIKDVRAFLPGSLVDVRPVRDPAYLEGKELEFKLIKLDRKRNNVVVSRRAVVESEHSEEREQLMDKLQEGAILKGVVKNLTDYGAFVDLGGIDGLLHITDMAWKRVRHPSEVVNVGDELDVRVLKFDRERNRVSLGLKQLGEDPWDNIARRYPANSRVFGKVSNVTDYGAFVEIEPGVEGLVHVSEMDWTNKNVNPSKVVQVGDEVEVMVLDVDEERRRISLGMKQVAANPWETFAAIHKKGDKVSGQIKSITDFGIFIGLDGGIDGLVHLSDISWNTTGEDVVRNFKKGDNLDAVVLAVDPERERISLGVKQLEQDPFGQYMAANPKGSKVEGVVKEVDAKGATIELADGIEGYVAARDVANERVDDATQFLKVGDKVEAKFVGMDRKGRTLQLSIKAKDDAEMREVLEEYQSSSASSGTTQLGALLRAQLNGNKSE